jgi:UDP-3-O-[3-hydroxymyristoyl] glucosamine N-acyltransferase
MMGGQAGIAGHLNIADGSQLNAQTGINSSIKEPNKKWGGSPYQAYQDYLRAQVNIRKLPDLEKRVKELENIITELKKDVH